MNLDPSLLLFLGLLASLGRGRGSGGGSSTSSSTTVSPALRKVVANATRAAAARRAAAQPPPPRTPAQAADPRRAALESAVTQALREQRAKDAGVKLEVGPATITSPAPSPAAPVHSEMPPPIMPAGPLEPRTPLQAAYDLRKFVVDTHRFGTATDRPREVQEAQRDLGLVPDGLIGPKTRAATRKLGVTLPAK